MRPISRFGSLIYDGHRAFARADGLVPPAANFVRYTRLAKVSPSGFRRNCPRAKRPQRSLHSSRSALAAWTVILALRRAYRQILRAPAQDRHVHPSRPPDPAGTPGSARRTRQGPAASQPVRHPQDRHEPETITISRQRSKQGHCADCRAPNGRTPTAD